MNEKPKQSRFRKRPLLVAGLGIAVMTVAACGGFSSGNLIALRCPDGGFDTETNCKAPTDGGTKDAGSDGGTGGDV